MFGGLIDKKATRWGVVICIKWQHL